MAALDQDVLHIDPAFAGTLGRAGLDDVQAVLDCVGDRLAAWSRTTDTIEVLTGGGRSVFVKRYHYPRWKNRIKGTFRGTFFGISRARAEFRALQTMRSLGIQAVRPVAYGERRRLHFVRSCFLITEAVPGAVSLATFAQKHAHDNHTTDSYRLRQEALTVLARQVRHMHQKKFVHGDLFWRNILIRVLGKEHFEYYFIDAGLGHRILRKGRQRREVMNDLAELMAIAPVFCSRSDMTRFVKVYLDQKALSSGDRVWMAQILRRARSYYDHEVLRLRLNAVFTQHLRDVERLAGAEPTLQEPSHRCAAR